MTDNIEHNEVPPESEEEKFTHEIDTEFTSYAEAEYTGIRKEFGKLAELGILTVEEGENVIKARQERYNTLDRNGRIVELVNNFRLWFPGGEYRQRLDEEITDESSEPEIEADRQLIADLDDVINSGAYGEYVYEVSKDNSPENRDQRLRLLGDVYLKMRHKNYDGEKLRR